MFAQRYFAPRYFAQRYFPQGAAAAAAGGTGSYFNGRYFGHRYFAARYFPGGATEIEPPVIVPPAPSGGGALRPVRGRLQRAWLHPFEQPDEYGLVVASRGRGPDRHVLLRTYYEAEISGLLQAHSVYRTRLGEKQLSIEMMLWFLNEFHK